MIFGNEASIDSLNQEFKNMVISQIPEKQASHNHSHNHNQILGRQHVLMGPGGHLITI